MKMTEFIKSRNIRIYNEQVDENPGQIDQDWIANHYKVRLSKSNPRKVLTIFFSMGTGFNNEPTVEMVLDCLASEALEVEAAGSFEEWATELGFDQDSRRAERCYKASLRQQTALKRFLGDDYEVLLYKVDAN